MRMHFGCLAVIILRTSYVRALPPILERDAQLEDAQTQPDQQESAMTQAVENEKYFQEAYFHPHYDDRFADRRLTDTEKHQYIIPLVQTYHATMEEIGVETFIAHGTLLGWWWNRRLLPWDDDVDVIVTERSIHYLAAFYNMSVHSFNVSGVGLCRNYLLEVNPHYSDDSIDTNNKIDARWIDMTSGLFVDITTLRRNRTAEALGIDEPMMVKDKHHYRYEDIFPLQQSLLEGAPVHVPFAYDELLVEEYGSEVLTKTSFDGFTFDQRMGEWVEVV